MSEVQSIIFEKRYWTKKRAQTWAAKHNFRSAKIDETENTYRIRQESPRRYKDFRTKTVPGKPSVKFVLGIGSWRR